MFIWLPTYKEWCLSLTAAVSACDFNSYSCNSSWVTSFICFPDHDCFFVGAAAWKLNPCCFGLERTRNNNSILFCLSTVVAAHNFNRFSCDSSWAEQLFHCITNLESLSIHVQWTRLHIHLVANGQGMIKPSDLPKRRQQQSKQQAGTILVLVFFKASDLLVIFYCYLSSFQTHFASQTCFARCLG